MEENNNNENGRERSVYSLHTDNFVHDHTKSIFSFTSTWISMNVLGYKYSMSKSQTFSCNTLSPNGKSITFGRQNL